MFTKLFKFLSISLAALCISGQASASVTLTIGKTGWGNFTTTGVNGMAWGVIVSSTGAAFDGNTATLLSTALQGFVIPSIQSPSSTPVQIGSTDFYFARAQANTATGGPPTFAAGNMNTVAFNLAGTVGTGDPLGLLWFAEGTTTNGSHFGYQNLSFNTPADGQTITSGINSTPGLASFTIGPVPEPSRILLLGFGLVGMIFRRRR